MHAVTKIVEDIDGIDEICQSVDVLSIVQIRRNFDKLVDKIIRENRDDFAKRAPES